MQDFAGIDPLGKNSAQTSQDRFRPQNVAQDRRRVNSVLQWYSHRRRAYEWACGFGGSTDVFRLACKEQNVGRGSAAASLKDIQPGQVDITVGTMHAQALGPHAAGTLCPQQEGHVQPG